MLKKILLTLLIVIAAILIFAATKPDTYRVERSITISAPPEKPFALIDDFHNWDLWSPWAHLDPNIKVTYSGPSSGKGAVPISAKPSVLTRFGPIGSSRPVTANTFAATSLALPAAAEITNSARPMRSLSATRGGLLCPPWRPGLSSPAKGERALRRISAMGALSVRIVEHG